MTDRPLRHPLVIWAAVLTVAGLWLTVRAVRSAPAQVRQIRAKAERLASLGEMAREQEAPDALLAALDEEGHTVPADLEGMLGEVFPRDDHRLEEGEPQTLRNGWRLRTAVVELDDVTLSQAGDFVARMENGRPPWRVIEYTVLPGPVSGRGRVSLTAEALQL